MAKLTANEIRRRDRVESVIRVIAPGLNLLLAAGERLSRVVEPDDPEYYPPRAEASESAVGAPPGSQE